MRTIRPKGTISDQLKQFERKFKVTPHEYVAAARSGERYDEHTLVWAINLSNVNYVRS